MTVCASRHWAERCVSSTDEADECLVSDFIAVLVVLVSQALMPAADTVHAQEVTEVKERKVETVTW